jgi:hypothetical protein
MNLYPNKKLGVLSVVATKTSWRRLFVDYGYPQFAPEIEARNRTTEKYCRRGEACVVTEKTDEITQNSQK